MRLKQGRLVDALALPRKGGVYRELLHPDIAHVQGSKLMGQRPPAQPHRRPQRNSQREDYQ